MSEVSCPHCALVYVNKYRVLSHIRQVHGKTKARKYKSEFMQVQEPSYTEAEYIIQGLIGER